MAKPRLEEGLNLVDEGADERWEDDGAEAYDGPGDSDLESLRDEFVDAFNARDLEALLALVHPDVECPDLVGDGRGTLAEELEGIWERSPGALLTRAFEGETPCALAWVPDEDGCWTRAALVCFDASNTLLSLVAIPDDADALERADAEAPTGDELEEWSDWSGWERGEETVPIERA